MGEEEKDKQAAPMETDAIEDEVVGASPNTPKNAMAGFVAAGNLSIHTHTNRKK
jgi:hypothetical protein